MLKAGRGSDVSTGDPASLWHRTRPRFDSAADRAERLLTEAGCGTRDHSHEVASLAGAIADRLELHADERRRVIATARLHDIGKSQIPASVVDKPGPLSPGEWELMHLHTVAGERIVSEIGESIAVARAVRHSHERWDGHGYPDGLRGREIPLASRIVFCADAFEAICSDRPYRAGRSLAEGIAELRRCAGSQFDPRIVAALIEVLRPRLHRVPHEGRRRRGRPAGVLVALAAGLIGASLALLADSTPTKSEAEPMALASGAGGEADPLAPPGLTELAPDSTGAGGEERDSDARSGDGDRKGEHGNADETTPAPAPSAAGVGGDGGDGLALGGGHAGGNGPAAGGHSGGSNGGGSSSHGNGDHGNGGGHSGGGGNGDGGGQSSHGEGRGRHRGGSSSVAPGGSGSALGQTKPKH